MVLAVSGQSEPSRYFKARSGRLLWSRAVP